MDSSVKRTICAGGGKVSINGNFAQQTADLMAMYLPMLTVFDQIQ